MAGCNGASSGPGLVEKVPVLIAYFAPEVALPMASAVAAVVGFIMLVGRAPFRLAGRVIRSVARGGIAPFRYVARGARGAARGIHSIAEKLEI